MYLITRRIKSIIFFCGSGILLLASCSSPQIETEKTNVITPSVSSAPQRTSTPVDVVSPTPSATPIKTRVIRLGTGFTGTDLFPYHQIIQEYEYANPDILIQLEPMPGTDYYSRLMSLVEANQAPDIIYLADDNLSYFVDKGVLAPMDDLQTDADFDPTAFYPGLLEPGQINGMQYLLPVDFSTLGLYYNRDLFDNAGLKYPTDDWTWDDLLTAARKLTKDRNKDGKPEQWGIQMNANWESGFEYWVRAAGGSLISEDGRKFIGYMDSPETIRAAKFYIDLYNTYKVAPPPADLNAWAGGNTEFSEGKAAMLIFGRWVENSFLQNPKIDLGIAAPPHDRVRANILFWSGNGVTSASKYPADSGKFLTYFNGKESGQTLKDWNLPVLSSIIDEAGFSTDPFQKIWYQELNYIKKRGYRYTPYWTETAQPEIKAALETMLTNPQAEPEQVIKEAARNAQMALDRFHP